jgi:glutathione S-transferase
MPPAPRLTLYVCALDEEGPPTHACRRAGEALRDAGHNFAKVMPDRDSPKGKRPELREATGQEKLPALKLTDGTTVVVGSKPIAEWAAGHDRTSIGKPVPVPGLPSGRAKEDV